VPVRISDDTPGTTNPTSPTTSTPKQSSPSTNTTPNSSKTTPSNPKTIDQTMKPNISPTPLARLEYDFLEDLKKTKANISLFELMKIPQIQENFIRTLQGKTSPGTKEANTGTKKGNHQGKFTNNNTPSKIQVVTNASLTGQRSRSTTPPFLITFEIFNRNVHNCMVDSGASSNVMPLKVCEKLNIKPEPSNIRLFS
jgi:hypothetical protein